MKALQTYLIKFRHSNFLRWSPHQFADDHTVVPVFSCKQFNRFEQGHFTITPYEIVGSPISCAFRLVQIVVKVETKDEYELEWPIGIQFFFDPRNVRADLRSRFVAITDHALTKLLKFRVEPILRSLVCDIAVRDLPSLGTLTRIQRHLCKVLNERLEPLGITVEEHDIVLGAINYPEEYAQQKLIHRHQDILIRSGLSQLDKLITIPNQGKFQSELLPLLMLLMAKFDSASSASEFSLGLRPIGD